MVESTQFSSCSFTGNIISVEQGNTPERLVFVIEHKSGSNKSVKIRFAAIGRYLTDAFSQERLYSGREITVTGGFTSLRPNEDGEIIINLRNAVVQNDDFHLTRNSGEERVFIPSKNQREGRQPIPRKYRQPVG